MAGDSNAIAGSAPERPAGRLTIWSAIAASVPALALVCGPVRADDLPAAALLAADAPAAAVPAAADRAAAHAPFEYEAPRVVAVGDVHGAIDKLTLLLNTAELTDANGHWSGGAAHLVLTGDLVDRGPADREVLDLARRLQGEAAAAGGRVHVLLGNHEVMNLVRDWRYVSAQSYAEFSDLERPADREHALQKFTSARRGSGETIKAINAAFDADHPFGYFGRLRAFGPGGEYAEWLLRQPALVKVNGVVFVHGGLTEDYARRGIATLNREVVENVRTFWRLRDELSRNGNHASYEQVQRTALEIVTYNSAAEERRAIARQLVALQSAPAFASDGPLWYRGLSLENERAEAESLDAVLSALDARAIVVGHTPTKTKHVQTRFHGRVVRTDAGLLANEAPTALVLEDGSFFVLQGSSGERVKLRAEPPWGEKWTGGTADLPDPQFERYLEVAQPTDIRPLGKGSTRPRLVELEKDRVRLRGLFKDVSDPPGHTGEPKHPADRYQHEIAAYRVDRLLGFGLVPVTVARRLEKTWGSMQAWVEAAVTPRTAELYGLESGDPAAVRSQLERGRVFDALIGNARRGRGDILLLPAESRVVLVDHGEAFTLEKDAGAIFGDLPCRLEPALRDALQNLKFEDVERSVGPLLNSQQIAALIARRDSILKVCA